jgi:hypothetical protein
MDLCAGRQVVRSTNYAASCQVSCPSVLAVVCVGFF